MKKDHIGDELLQLRKAADLSQKDMAEKMGVDQSSVSRLEGAADPDKADVHKYVAALNGTPAAKEFAEHLDTKWKYLEKPHFKHPFRHELCAAEAAIVKLRVFAAKPGTPADLIGQAKLYEQGLRETATFLFDLRHNLAFVGKIAVGKTTALCFVTDLLVNDAKTLKQKVALDTGAGWTTQSEVRVGTLDSGLEETGKFGIVVYPHPQEEVSRLASDVCHSLFAIRDGKESESRVAEEVEKVLRSMAELPRKPSKTTDEDLYDPLLELAKTFNTPEKLTAEFQSRMKLHERTETGLWFDAPSEEEGLVWLREEFRKVNNGRNPKVSLAKRIDVFVPRALIPDCIYELTCVDTKGTDETAIRPDLQTYFDDPRTVTILCSHFAPDANMIEVLGHLAATGKAAAISERVIFLLLPREEEALSMNSEDGTMFETVNEAYALREAQIRSKLAKYPGGRDVPIVSYDSVKEQPDKVRKKLLKKIEDIRAAQATRLKTLASATEDLVSKFELEQAKAAFGKLRKKLQEFVDTYQALPQQTIKAQNRIVYEFNHRHARTVWASARRNGEWDNLNSYNIVGISANEDAEVRAKAAATALDTVLDDLSKDPECTAIESHLTVLKTNVAAWKLAFLKKVASRSQEIYRATLFPDNPLWDTCEGFWGGGKGFRDRVAGEVEKWLQDKGHEWIHQAVDAIIRADWQDMFLEPLREQAKEP